jgi:flagellar biogenesis protein FliO
MVVSCTRHIGEFFASVMLLLVCATSALAEVAGDVAPKALPPELSPVMGTSMIGSSLKMVGALFFCLCVFAVGVRIARKFSPVQKTSRQRRIEVREKVALNSKAAVYLIAVDNREYLIASGSESVSMLPTHSVTTPLFAESLDEIYDDSGEAHV